MMSRASETRRTQAQFFANYDYAQLFDSSRRTF